MADFEVSNFSYTNKDFQDIYVELLDLAKKLSLKWDPSQSNESDPGVVLIKELALIADKLNYNLDKNILETFPSTVTQIGNARKLFEQLGYNMRWYHSGTSEISMQYSGDEIIADKIPIPKFTMVADDESNIVYTITDSKSLNASATTKFNVIEGIATEFTVNGKTEISSINLDADNRIYFIENNVAENGIFITNIDEYGESVNNYDEWKSVNNLTVEPYTVGDTLNRIYKFGVLADGNTCYIEFPDNAQSLINYGIKITYIVSNGYDGNIKANTLSRLYNDVTINVDGRDILINNEKIRISNLSAIGNGYNPEDIDEAYRNYRKTVGTFNTLVSLRDYMNAINTSRLVSNSFVTDRTDDIQSSYHIVSRAVGDLRRELKIVMYDDAPEMNAFDLKLYAFQNVDDVNSMVACDSTYKIIPYVEVGSDTIIDESIYNILDYIGETKSIQHDFQPQKSGRVCMIVNRFPVHCTIIPEHRVTKTQATAIKSDVAKCLFENFNSQKIEFGQEVSYDKMYNDILRCNDLIKAVMLSDFVYESYAIYYDSDINKYTPVKISGSLNNNQYYGRWNGSSFDNASKNGEWETNDRCLDINTGNVYVYDEDSTTQKWALDKTATIQDDIYTKSVLNGNTQLFVQDEDFDYTYTQEPAEIQDISGSSVDNPIQNVSELNTNSIISINFNRGRASYTLQSNENIMLYAPNYVDTQTFTIGVRFQYILNNSVPADSVYKLSGTETICFYYKDEDSEEADYKYVMYGEGTLISPTFALPRNGNATTNLEYNITSVPYIPAAMGIYPRSASSSGDALQGDVVGGRIAVGNKTLTCKEFISNYLSSTANNLSANKCVTIKKKNEKTLVQDSLTKYIPECYWILNKTITVDDKEYYVLFGDNDTTYTLNSNEYFMYTNQNHSEFEILGPGTTISRASNLGEWKCEAIKNAYQTILTDGVKSLNKYWVTFSEGDSVKVTENTIYTIGEGAELRLNLYGWSQQCDWEIDTDDNFISDNCVPGYFDPESTGSNIGKFYKYKTGGVYSDQYMPNDATNILDMNHIYVDSQGRGVFVRFAGDTVRRVTNSSVQMTAKYSDENTPYFIYVSSGGDANIGDNLNQFFELPYSSTCRAVYLIYESGTLSLEEAYKAVPSEFNISDGSIDVRNYVNITNDLINAVGVGFYNDDALVLGELNKQPYTSSASNPVYYTNPENSNEAKIWSVIPNTQFNPTTVTFDVSGCRVSSKDGTTDSLNDFAISYVYQNEIVRIPALIGTDKWSGKSVLNIDVSNSKAQIFEQGQYAIAKIENDDSSVLLSSLYKWSDAVNDSTLVNNFYNLSENPPSETPLAGGYTTVTAHIGDTISGYDIKVHIAFDDAGFYDIIDKETPKSGDIAVQVTSVDEIPYRTSYAKIIDDNKLNILSNKEIIADGPSVNTTETTLTGSNEHVNLYGYYYKADSGIVSEGDVGNRVVYNNDGSVKLSFSQDIVSSVNPIYVDFELFKGNYIIPISVEYKNTPAISAYGIQIKIESKDDASASWNPETDADSSVIELSTNHALNGLTVPKDLEFYVKINLTDSKKYYRFTYGFQVAPTQNDVIVTMGNIYRYVAPRTGKYIEINGDNETEYMSENTLETIVQNTIRLSGKNGEFYFIYQVPSDDEIVNPLDANSFFNENHIYNKFTIGKMLSSNDLADTYTGGKNLPEEPYINIMYIQR